MGHDSAPPGDPSGSRQPSVEEWIASLKRGSETAPQKIWHRYVEALAREADKRLKNRRRVADGEDVAQKVFDEFFRAVQQGRFSKLDDRDDLWQILIMLANRRAADFLRRELGPTRGGGHVRGDSATAGADQSGSELGGFDSLPAPPVTPESADDLIHLIELSFPKLANETLREIAIERAANYSIAEIATLRGISEAAVRRKLDLIRDIMERTVYVGK